METKDIVLFINGVHSPTYQALRTHQEKTGQKLQPVVIVDRRIRESIHDLNGQQHLDGNATVISADFGSPASIRRALAPYHARLLAVTSQYENSIAELKALIPYLPYLPAPTETSLDWATDKKLMRQAFNSYDRSLSPQSAEVVDASAATVQRIERMMAYPMIIKPSGLERSLLVAVVHDRRELVDTLRFTLAQLHKAYRKWMKRLEPSVLVEEFMAGDMYFIDTYIAADGGCRHTPPVKVITGHKAGFEDFFAYLQMTPAGLSKQEITRAERTAEKACRALGLRSVTAHTELMKTPAGWKIIEVGPRIGGYRHELYSLSHGMNHIANDVINRAGLAPDIQPAAKHHAAIFKTYARDEGCLVDIRGLDTIRHLPSFIAVKTPHAPGDMMLFAKNNGDAAIEVTLCHHDRDQLEADIRQLEQVLDIAVSTHPAAVRVTAGSDR